MSRKDARRAAMISAMLARLKNSWDKRTERKRQESLDKMTEQLRQYQLSEAQYRQDTRPTVEEAIAATKRGIERDELGLEDLRAEAKQRPAKEAEAKRRADYESKRDQFELERLESESRGRPLREAEAKRRAAYEERKAQLDLEEKEAAAKARPSKERRTVDEEILRNELLREQVRKAKEPKERTFDDLAKELGIDDKGKFAAFEALEGAGNDESKAIEALTKQIAERRAGGGTGSVDEGEDERDAAAMGRLLLQRARRGGMFGAPAQQVGQPGDARKRAEAQVDASTMQTAMAAAPMIFNRNAPLQQQAEAWSTLERLGLIQSPHWAKDFYKHGAQTFQQFQEGSQPQAPDTRVPTAGSGPPATSKPAARPIRHTQLESWQRPEVPGSRYDMPPNPMAIPSPGSTMFENLRPAPGERQQKPAPRAPFASALQPLGPPPPPEMTLDFMQAPPPPSDPYQSMFDRIRALRTQLERGEAQVDPIDDLLQGATGDGKRYSRGRGF